MTEIDPAEARRRIDAGEAVLVDVREPHEWEAGHAPTPCTGRWADSTPPSSPAAR